MTQAAVQNPGLQQVSGQSFARHMMGVSLFIQASVMEKLQQEDGHETLRINFEPYFGLAARGGVRLSEIADALSISRQAANQVVDQIEAAGFLIRQADASDGRAKLLKLTARGERVVSDGARQALRLERRMRELAGSKALIAAEATLLALCNALQLLPAYQRERDSAPILALLLPPISNYVNNELMELTRVKGHPHLKPNFAQVLSGIGPQGGRIQHIARTQNVSKQAIGTIVARLEELGYLKRVVDPLDARGQVLHFTRNGNQLIADAVASEAELRQRMAGIIGEECLDQLQNTMAKLYRALQLDGQASLEGDADISSLASDLFARLGSQGATELAQRLLKHAEWEEERNLKETSS